MVRPGGNVVVEFAKPRVRPQLRVRHVTDRLVRLRDIERMMRAADLAADAYIARGRGFRNPCGNAPTTAQGAGPPRLGL